MNDSESMSVSPISFPSGKGAFTHALCYGNTGKSDVSKYPPRESSSKNTTCNSVDVSQVRRVTDDSLELSSAKHLQRSLLTVKRKDIARRQLMCSMYTKHNNVKRSFSFVAGERPTELKFPSVSTHKDETNWTRDKIDKRHRNISKRYTATSSDNKHVTYITSKSEHSQSGTSNRVPDNKVNLPEIIMDFNFETNLAQHCRGTNMTSLSDSDDEERAMGAPYEDYLKSTKLLANNPYTVRHRPVTPGLLESLNKLRLPSKTKTEQWLKSVSSTRKSYCDPNYKVGNLVNSNLAIPNWIYTDEYY